MGIAHSIQDRFSLKTFAVGLLGVALLYVLLFGYLFFAKTQTLQGLESRLASQTVLIDRHGDVLAVSDTPSPQQNHGDDHGDTAHMDSPHSDVQGEPAAEHEESLEDIIGHQAKALREAPVSGFFEESEYGRLPIAKSPMQTPFEIYKKPFILNRSEPFIAVAIQDFGLSKELSEAMIADLPSSVSFILSPYSAHPEEWVQKARQDGHEIWLHMPIENNNFPMDDPGSKGLLTRVSLQYNQDRLKWLMGRATGYAGIASFTDSALSNSGSMFKNMARNVFGRGLGFFELNTGSDVFLGGVAEEMRAPQAQNFALLDRIDPQHPSLKAVQAQIANSGGAVVVLEPSPRNIPALKKWLGSLERRGILSVPVSAVANPDIERN